MGRDRRSCSAACGGPGVWSAHKEVSVSGSNRYTPEQIENILFSGRWETIRSWLLSGIKHSPQTDPFCGEI